MWFTHGTWWNHFVPTQAPAWPCAKASSEALLSWGRVANVQSPRLGHEKKYGFSGTNKVQIPEKHGPPKRCLEYQEWHERPVLSTWIQRYAVLEPLPLACRLLAVNRSRPTESDDAPRWTETWSVLLFCNRFGKTSKLFCHPSPSRCTFLHHTSENFSGSLS